MTPLLQDAAKLTAVSIMVSVFGSAVAAQNVSLLLFDAETSMRFAGCLNCSRYDDGAVCNQYGDYGSRYEEMSIWNQYGEVGSRHEDNSPWNRYSDGLIVVDPEGNFYGHFSTNPYARWGQSSLPVIQSLLRLYEAGVELDEIRKLLCEE